MKRSLLKAVSLMLAILMLLICAACKNDNADASNPSSADSAMSSTESGEPNTAEPNAPKVYSVNWKNVPFISQELIDAGYEGGEAGQMVLGLTFDHDDGKLGFFGTDVAGVYRTTDGGAHWELSCIGWDDGGGTGFAIDPTNKDRVIGIGTRSSKPYEHGIYLSTNAGDSWDRVYTAITVGYRDTRAQFAFDKSSYDEKLGYCTVVYWSRENNVNERNSSAKGNDPSLYKSTDGGVTWNKLENTDAYGGGDIYVNAENGDVYVSNSSGAYVSKDGGKSFNKMLEATVNSMNCVYTAPNNIYITTDKALYVSKNGGVSFETVNGPSYPGIFSRAIKVSPVNQNNMVLQQSQDSRTGKRWNYYSKDGGKTWTESLRPSTNVDNMEFAEGHMLPSGTMMAAFAWSPVDENTVFTCWKHIVKSTDGGAVYKWSNAGYAAIYGSGLIRFNINNPDLIAISSQDYSGGYSIDGGKTWTYAAYTGDGWGGYTYGAYCLDEKTSWVGRTNEWHGTLYLTVTHDGGKTFDRTSILVTGHYAGYGALGSDSIGFLGEWRTADKGYTWKDMSKSGAGCNGVMTHDSETGRLWGANAKQQVVYSDNNGESWVAYAEPDGDITDMSYDHVNKKLYVTAGDKLYVTEVESADKAFVELNYCDNRFATNVAVDPNNTNIVYVSAEDGTNQYENHQSCFRSLDGGKTWECVTRYKGDGKDDQPYGTRGIDSIVVNAKTSELFAHTHCAGIWKLAPPELE